MMRDPLKVVALVGVNVTWMVQYDPPASVDGLIGQLFVCANALVALILPMVKGPAPLFVSLTDCGALVTDTGCVVKTRLVGFKLTPGAGEVPTPARSTTCGLPPVLSAIINTPCRFVATDGVNVIEIAQFDPAATVFVLGLTGHVVLLTAKSPLVEDMLVIARGAFPTLYTVTVCGAEVVPTVTLPNEKLSELRLTIGAAPVPVPVRVTELLLAVPPVPPLLLLTVNVAVRVPFPDGSNSTP